MGLWGKKMTEIQVIKRGRGDSRAIGLSVGMSFRRHHAGLYVSFDCWRYELVIQVYDGRHWCSEHGCWFDEKKHPFHED